jgi:hypothetical protein
VSEQRKTRKRNVYLEISFGRCKTRDGIYRYMAFPTYIYIYMQEERLSANGQLILSRIHVYLTCGECVQEPCTALMDHALAVSSFENMCHHHLRNVHFQVHGDQINDIEWHVKPIFLYVLYTYIIFVQNCLWQDK